MDEDNEYGQWTSSTDDMLKTKFPMHHACRDGDLQILSVLLSTGNYNLYEEDDLYGWTPVHWAAYFGKLTCLMRLLEHDGSFDSTTNRFSQTPAHIAAFAGKGHCLKWLLHCGAMIDRQLACLRKLTSLSNDGRLCHCCTTRFGQSPLHLASLRDHPHCVQWIIQTGANIEVQDYLGEAPIHKAARTGSMECVSLLVSQGCNLSMQNHNHHIPSQVAAECGYHECAKYLERAAKIQQHTMGSLVSHTDTPPTIPQGISGHQSETNPGVMNGGIHIPGLAAKDFAMATSDMDMAEPMGAVADNHMQDQEVMSFRTGVKRGRQDLEEECLKRMRRAGPVLSSTLGGYPVHQQVNGCLGHKDKQFLYLNPDDITDGVNNNYEGAMVSSSALEHYSCVTMQYGYENLYLESVILTSHGS